MRVALDATPLTLSSGGLRRYTEQLAHALADEYPHDVFSLLSDQAFHFVPHAAHNLRAAPLPHTRLERRWWLFGAAFAMRRLHAEVFHGTNFEVPYLNFRPSVLTLHDLSPWRDRKWHHSAARVRARTPWLVGLGIATMVITPSEAIRREAIQHFDLPPERVVAIPLGAAELPPPEVSASYARPYFLFVGTIEPRKNLTLLVEAWRTLRLQHDAGLVLAGRRREDGQTFETEPGLHILGEVSDAQLAALYRGALALIYPSAYEGFGLPVLEAMQCGAAIVITGDPALVELGGDAALQANTPRELSAVMRALILEPELRTRHQEKSLRRAAQYSWRECARSTHAVYGEAIARFG